VKYKSKIFIFQGIFGIKGVKSTRPPAVKDIHAAIKKGRRIEIRAPAVMV
jgi:hypothetical protein